MASQLEQIDAAYKALIYHTRKQTRFRKRMRARWVRRRAKDVLARGEEPQNLNGKYKGWAS